MRSRDNETKIGLADQVGHWKIVSSVAARDLRRQAEMAGDERIGRGAVALLLPASRELLLARRLEQHILLDQGGVLIDERTRTSWSVSCACPTLQSGNLNGPLAPASMAQD